MEIGIHKPKKKKKKDMKKGRLTDADAHKELKQSITGRQNPEMHKYGLLMFLHVDAHTDAHTHGWVKHTKQQRNSTTSS